MRSLPLDPKKCTSARSVGQRGGSGSDGTSNAGPGANALSPEPGCAERESRTSKREGQGLGEDPAERQMGYRHRRIWMDFLPVQEPAAFRSIRLERKIGIGTALEAPRAAVLAREGGGGFDSRRAD